METTSIQWRGETWAVEDFGGGCEAYVRTDADGVYWVLQGDDANLPEVGGAANLASFASEVAFSEGEDVLTNENIRYWNA